MDPSYTGWWRRHGWTVALLLTAFGISFAIRTIWTYPVVAQWGPLFTYAGGSDSYYHSRVTTYIIENHRNLIFDPLLKFPIGAINPREPLFDWMNAVLGIVFSPFFGGNAVTAGAWFLDLQAPLWAALGVFPVYLIGREVSGRRAGLIAALIYPFLSANIDSSIFGYANYLSFYTFIILVVVYSYIRTVKAVGNRRWVESYRNPRSYLPGLRGFFRTERTAVKWAVFTGVGLGALALAWQGYTYAVVVIGISVFIAMIAERIRRVDSFGLYVATWIVGLVGFPMAMPYYLVQHQFTIWFDLPLLLYFGVLLLLLPFLLLRDVPWVFSVPLLGLLVAAAAGLLAVVNPGYFTSIVTGQGYFVKNLIYSTVAEAQAPSIDSLVIGYGVVTFFLAFIGLAIFVYVLVRGRFKRYHVVFLVFSVLSIYLPISAAKFFLLGSPVFALLPAEALRRALDVASYPELRRTVASLSDRRSQLSAFRRAFKARHVLVMALVVGLLLPNVWVAIDAGIPGNTKSQFSSQVAATLPPWLQPNTSSPSSYYFGAAGSSLDTPNQYDSAAYNWLAQQDTNLPPAQRPAFLSWWDYGFQAIDQGDHPSVADNFQNGIDPSGQFLLSQNESQAIAVLATTLLSSELVKTGATYLPGGLDRVVAQDGVNVAQLNSYLANVSADYNLVLAHPERYLPVNPSTLTDQNAMYLVVEYYLASALPLAGVAKLYNDVQAYTGWSIRYIAADTRLFPFSGTDTGIYYAPAELTGRVVDSAGIPTTFFNVYINGSDGNTYAAGQLPAGVSPISYSIAYYAPFYNSMIYRTYIGYNGTDIGDAAGIPGLAGSQTVINSPLMPGWMLEHFELEYKTAYYCPQANASSGSSCLVAMNLPQAVALQAKNGGTLDTSAGSYFGGGESMLEYYPGQTLLGEVVLPGGTPVAGARVTVADGSGIPHMTTFTAADGSFSLVLPPGNDTVNVTVGSLNGLLQQGSVVLKSAKIAVPDALGFSYDAPNLVQSFTVAPATAQGFVYWNSNNSGFVPRVDPLVPGAKIVLWGGNGTAAVHATTDASGSFAITNVPPGVYQYNVLYGGRNYTEGTVTLSPGELYNATVGLSPGIFSGQVKDTTGSIVPGATVELANASGVVATATSNATGLYSINSVGPGNYTITAVSSPANVRSAGVAVSAATPGQNVTTNLTVRATSTVTLSVTASGAPAPDIPVRFVPVASFANASSPIGPLLNATSNSTVVATAANGVTTAVLAPGAYSVYALGYVGSTLSAGLGNLTVAAANLSLSDSLSLTRAVRLNGTVSAPGTVTNETLRVVVAYAASGSEAVAWANTSTGAYAFILPSGAYSLLALTGTASSATGLSAALASVSLTGSSALALTPVAAIESRFSVGSTLPTGALFPAAGATVVVSTGSGGPAVPATADSGGNVTYFLPSVLPSSAPTYCVRAQAIGFTTASECGVSPSGLSALTKFPLLLPNVSVTLTVVGLPSGTSVNVNLTAESPSAASRTLSGGPSFAFSAPPGLYGVGAWASQSNGTIYLPSSILSTTIPLGATYSNLTLYLLPQVGAKGTLSAPAGIPLGDVNLTLRSSVLTLTVNGTAFTSGFRATPGTYSTYANVTSAGVTYSNLTRLTIATSGQVTPTFSLSVSGVKLLGSLTGPLGGATSLNTTVALTNPSGAVVTVPVSDGSFTITLPPGVRYSLAANATSVSAGPNGSFVQTWASEPGASCTPTAATPACLLPMVPTTELVWVNGTLSSPGVTGPVSGTVWLVGPYPSTNVTEVSAPGGSFAVRMLPGAYSVYANATGLGSLRAAFGSTLALPSSPGELSLSLAPTWTATIALAPPNGTTVGLGATTLTLANAAGNRLVFAGLSGNSRVMIALPAGTYTASAVASGTLNGVAANASASSTFTVTNGNVGVSVPLAYRLVFRVSATLTGSTSATVRTGGTATFGFSLRNTGNVPVTVTPVGTPAYWSFSFSFTSVTLAPGGSSVSGEVLITVPNGTPVNHPGLTLEFKVSNGTVVGHTSPNPTVNVVGYFGLASGPATLPVEAGPKQAITPFYVDNTGNVYEDVTFSVVDAPRLAGLGWKPSVTLESQQPITTYGMPPTENQTFFVILNATGPAFVPPGSVTVSIAVVNASGGVQRTVTLPVTYGKVQAKTPPGGAPVTVTGPSIGTAPTSLPDWLVPLLAFVPAIALAVGVITYRWWRTRRWNRR
jgi:dolichyl-phosphooligosaccharide-protein glycotransferase